MFISSTHTSTANNIGQLPEQREEVNNATESSDKTRQDQFTNRQRQHINNGTEDNNKANRNKTCNEEKEVVDND